MPNDTTIPADAIAGLLVGWTGPALVKARGSDDWEPEVVDCGDKGPRMSWCGRLVRIEMDHIRLNCLRPEVQARVGSVLAAGVRCPACHGTGSSGEMELGDWHPPLCAMCKTERGATGRLPKPIHHILDAARTNALSPQHIAEAVAWSVRNVARGGGVLRGVAGEWAPSRATIGRSIQDCDTVDTFHRECICGDIRSVRVHVAGGRAERMRLGWSIDTERGPETGPEGRAKADAALLAANIGYIDGGALVLPGGES